MFVVVISNDLRSFSSSVRALTIAGVVLVSGSIMVLDRIVVKQVLEIVVDELLEKKLQLVVDSLIVEQLVHHKNVVVHEMGSIVVKQRIAVDNTESSLNKMENWQLKQSNPDTFVFLNELHLHELHVALDVYTSDQSW
nr:hypothetical protein [Tanacetum cinerariifolium]